MTTVVNFLSLGIGLYGNYVFVAQAMKFFKKDNPVYGVLFLAGVLGPFYHLFVLVAEDGIKEWSANNLWITIIFLLNQLVVPGVYIYDLLLDTANPKKWFDPESFDALSALSISFLPASEYGFFFIYLDELALHYMNN